MRTVTVLRGAAEIAPLFYGVGHLGKFIGGYVRYMVSPNREPAEAGDIDIYPNTPDAADMIQEWICTNIKLTPSVRGKKVHSTTLSDTYKPVEGRTIQVIKPVNQGAVVALGTMEEVINNFDFTICRAGLVSLTEAIVDDSFLQAEMNKRLVIKSIHCPLGAIKRIAKYSKKGYYISPSELYKLFNDWDKRGQDYKDELRDAIAAYEDFKAGTPTDPDELSTWDVGSDVVNKMAQLIYVD